MAYKALFTARDAQGPATVIELGCMAHARRKFFELHAANGSPIAFEALTRIAALYEIERRAKQCNAEDRQTRRLSEAMPLLASMKAWLLQTGTSTANGGALARASDYSLRRWVALSRYAESGHLPLDNNPIENAIRAIAIGKKNWMFTGSKRAGERAAAIQSLFATAKKNRIDPIRAAGSPMSSRSCPPGRTAASMSCCRFQAIASANSIRVRLIDGAAGRLRRIAD